MSDNDNDIGLDLGEDLSLDFDGEDLGLGFDEDDSEGFDVELDENSDFNMEIGGGPEKQSNYDIDIFGIEDESLEADSETSLPDIQRDISKDLINYYRIAQDAYDKLFPRLSVDTGIKKEHPTLMDFRFIINAQTRKKVYGFFCTTLDDLTTESEYKDFDEEQAFEYLVKEMYNDLHWSPTVHKDKLYHIFSSYYERNKKLNSILNTAPVLPVTKFIDKEQIEQSLELFYVNSMPFVVVSNFFDNPEMDLYQGLMGTRMLGDLSKSFLDDYNAQLLSQGKMPEQLSFSIARNGLLSFLKSEETAKILSVPFEDIQRMTLGEVLRRYLQYELNSGIFYPENIAKVTNFTYSDDLLGAFATQLVIGVRQGSLTAEMLVLIMNMMTANAQKVKDKRDYIEPFVCGICRYLADFMMDSKFINPAFYSFIGYHGLDDEGKPIVELACADAGQSRLVFTDSFLYEVLGDNAGVYQLPLALFDPSMSCAIMPPTTVVENIKNVTTPGRFTVSGTICYRYRPTHQYLSSLDLASDDTTMEPKTISNASNVTSPILNTLLTYTNLFDTNGEQPEVVSLSLSDGSYFCGVRRNKDEGIIIPAMRLANGDTAEGDGTCLMDDDGSIIVRYQSVQLGKEQVLVYGEDDYEEDIAEVHNDSPLDTSISLKDILGLTSQIDENVGSMFRALNKKLCELTSIDYDMELEEARNRIIRDCGGILSLERLDNLIGYKLIEHYLNLDNIVPPQPDDTKAEVSGLNLDTLQEIVRMTYGKLDFIDEEILFTPEIKAKLEEYWKSNPISIDDIIRPLRIMDLHLLALQTLSTSELNWSGTQDLYMAVHYIPEIHVKLRYLEEQFITLQILAKIGEDAAAIIRKSSVMTSVYNNICTRDSWSFLDNKICSGIRTIKLKTCLTATNAILFTSVPEGAVIVKYSILDNNLFGILVSLEEELPVAPEDHIALYNHMKQDLGFEEDKKFSDMTGAEFESCILMDLRSSVLHKYESELLNVVIDGIVAEIGHTQDIQMLKVYDMLTCYGPVLFRFTDADLEDFSDTSEFKDAFGSYVGSMLVSYSPVVDDAANDIDGGMDRAIAYYQHKNDFRCYVDLTQFEQYKLVDTHSTEDEDSDFEF